MKAKMYHNLVSFQLVRRMNWLLKISTYKDRYVGVVAQHIYDGQVVIRHFNDFNKASDFIEWLIEQETT